MHAVEKYISIIQLCIDAASKYISKISYLELEGKDSENFLIIKNILTKRVDKNIAIFDKNLDTIFRVFNILDNLRKDISSLYRYIEKYSPSIDRVGSFTSSGESITNAMIIDAVTNYNRFGEMYRILLNYDDINFLEKALSDDIVFSVEDLIKYRSNNTLYRYLISVKITRAVPEEIRILYKELDLIKSGLLSRELVKTSINPVQTLVQVYTVPDKECRTIAQLSAEIGIPSKDIEELKSKSDKKIVYIAYDCPIEYNLRILFDYNYLSSRDLLVTPTEGISAKYIDRTRTMKMLSGDSESRLDIPDIESDSMVPIYIIQKLRGDNYRFLTPWIGEEKAVPYHIQKFTKSPSPIVAGYNYRFCKVLENISREPYIYDEDELDFTRKHIKAKIISLNLDYNNAVYDSRLYNLISEEIYAAAMELLDIERIPLSRRANIVREINISYIYEMDSVLSSIKKTATNMYIREYKLRFEEEVRDDKRGLIYQEMIDDILKIFAGSQNNIFSNIRKKFILLLS